MGRDAHVRTMWLARHILPNEPSLRSWLRRRHLAGLEVDDIIQEAYARLLAVEDVTAIRNPRAYLFSTARSVILTQARRARVVSFETIASLEQLAAIADETPSPETQAADREDLQRLAESIATLPKQAGLVFRLRRIEGLSQRQIAERLRIAESTVEKHMGKAIFLLMERFGRGRNSPDDASSVTEAGLQRAHGQKYRKRN